MSGEESLCEPSNRKAAAMRYGIRELGVGGILDQAVRLTKDHFGLLFGVTLVLLVPFGLIQGFVQLAIAPEMPASPTREDIAAIQQANLANLRYTLPVGLLGVLFVIPVTNAALIHTIANKYLELPATVGGSLGRAFGILLPLIGTWILVYLAVVGGLILFVIPGILCAFWFVLATQVVVVEGVSGFAALKRSRTLMKGNIGTIFALGLLVFVISLGLGLGAGLIPQPHLRVVVAAFVQAVATIFGAATAVVFYFSCRCKHEDFDLALLAQTVGAEPPEDAATDAWVDE